MINFKEIKDFNSENLDYQKLNQHREYFYKYYNDCFKQEQGTETILEAIKEFCPGGEWLDLGCGSSTLFWSLMTENIKSISCCDYDVEALQILHDFSLQKDIPKCYLDVIDIYKLDANILDANRKKISNYYVFDSLNQWPTQMKEKRYDYITEFGVFGLSKTSEGFINCFNYMIGSLNKAGIAIGANWVLSHEYSKRRNHFNNYISCELVDEAVKIFNLELLFLKEVAIKNDIDYDKVIVWAIKNNDTN